MSNDSPDRSKSSYDELVEQRLQRAKKEQELLSKYDTADLSERWFVRYPLSFLMLIMAFTFYKMWIDGFAPGILKVFANPIMPIVIGVMAIINAWELAAVVIFLAVLYFLFIGVASLPVSVAVIVGSLIIAYAVAKLKR